MEGRVRVWYFNNTRTLFSFPPLRSFSLFLSIRSYPSLFLSSPPPPPHVFFLSRWLSPNHGLTAHLIAENLFRILSDFEVIFQISVFLYIYIYVSIKSNIENFGSVSNSVFNAVFVYWILSFHNPDLFGCSRKLDCSRFCFCF